MNKILLVFLSFFSFTATAVDSCAGLDDEYTCHYLKAIGPCKKATKEDVLFSCIYVLDDKNRADIDRKRNEYYGRIIPTPKRK